MSCQKAQELIHPYIDGELPLAQATEFERHIEGCEDCCLGYQDQIRLRLSLKDSSLYHHAPPDLQKRIQASMPEETVVADAVSI